MKAVVCRALGDLSTLSLEDIDLPKAGPGEIRLRVRACGINFADSLMVAGKYQRKIEPPFVPGFEVSGDVTAVGEGVDDIAVGDRIMGLVPSGGYAEEAVGPAATFSQLPAGMDYDLAASFTVTYGTGYVALARRARLAAGEVLMVHGAAGGTGLAAIEIGKALGATVIATAGGAQKLAVAEAAGADHLINYRSEDIRSRVKALTDGRGADVIYDPVGGDVFEASLRCIAFEGRIIVIGFAGGRIQKIPSNHLMVKNVDVIGVNRGGYDERRPELARASNEALKVLLQEGRLKPLVSETCALEDAIHKLNSVVKRKTIGKVIIKP